ncbi:MAG: invasion associated locus B family protein, partial [Paracoccaceae bacterium]
MKTPQITSLALALTLGLAVPLFAQETTETPAPEAPAVAGDAAGGDGLSMGAEIGAPAAAGDTYVAAAFDAWEQRCIKTDLGADPCQLYQLLKDDQGNSVAEFSVFSLPEGSQGP